MPLELGYITTSSPPIVVNDVLVVGNSAEQGYNQTRVENVPGDILGYDAKTGKFLWKFHVIPRPGEFGHDTWENDAWRWTGDVSSWAPMSADPARGLVYIPTNGATIDYFGGFRPGDNLFSTSVIALDVKTGKRVWHQQLVKHDIWNYDTPTAPMLLDVNVDGRRIPGVFQITKQSFVYSFNRQTGEPIWPIEERPAPPSKVPAEKLPEMQPLPTKPAPFDLQGRTEARPHRLHAGDQEAGARAGQEARPAGAAVRAADAIAATPKAAARPTSVRWRRRRQHHRPAGRRSGDRHHLHRLDERLLADAAAPAKENDNAEMTGKTLADVGADARRPAGRRRRGRAERSAARHPRHLQGAVGRIMAIDMNTGEHLWMIPHGDMAQRDQEAFREQPAAQERATSTPTGAAAVTPALVATSTLLWRRARPPTTAAPVRHRQEDRQAGRRGRDAALGGYGLMTYMHQGKQYIVVPINGGYTAMALP